jgi:lysophospholipid acyltransferase (LPLAT)-like uncharacterized protein
MKIRKPWIIKCVALLAAWVVRLYGTTICFRLRPLGPNLDPRRRDLGGPFIYAFWHETVFVPFASFGSRKIICLISQHADGEIMAQACHHVGFRVERGSSTRGGVEAVRRLLRVGKKAHFAVLPDGPRGPRRKLEPGIVFLASRTGMPLVLAGIGYDRPWRLPTWDRFAVPRPWSGAMILLGEPMFVPPDLTRSELEEYRRQAEDLLNALTNHAERLAERRGIGYLG